MTSLRQPTLTFTTTIAKYCFTVKAAQRRRKYGRSDVRYGRAVQLEAEVLAWSGALHRALPLLRAAYECFALAGDAGALRGASGLLETLVAVAKGESLP